MEVVYVIIVADCLGGNGNETPTTESASSLRVVTNDLLYLFFVERVFSGRNYT